MKFLIAIAIACLPLSGFAQSYPAKPVRLVVTAAPGGSDDFQGRLVAQRLTELLGVNVGLEPEVSTPEQLAERLRSNQDKIGKIIRDAGIKLE